MEAQVQLQEEVDKWQRASTELGTALREAKAGREQAEEHLERLQGSLRDLQTHSQERGNYDELQARFKEVSNLQLHCPWFHAVFQAQHVLCRPLMTVKSCDAALPASSRC